MEVSAFLVESAAKCRFAYSDGRIQPWSTYAVFQTTLTHWSFLWDWLLVYMYFWTTASWNYETRELGFVLLAVWIFFIGKFTKTLGHYIRYPVDFLLLPLSIGFGYLHGFIKLHGLLSINVVSSFNLHPDI